MKNSLVRRILVALMATPLLLGAVACGDDDNDNSAAASKDLGSVVVVSQGFTEADILTQLYAALLTNAGFDVSTRNYAGRDVYLDALIKGDEVQISADYLSSMTEALNRKANGDDAAKVASSDTEETLAELNKLGEKYGLTALTPAQAQDANAFAVTQAFADEHDLSTLSDLGASGIAVHLFANSDCPDRDDCQKGLENAYGINVNGFDGTGFGSEATKKAVQDFKGGAALASLGTSDATLDKYGLVILDDDKDLQNAENLVPVVNSDWLAAHPEAKAALEPLASVLTTDDLVALNGKVDNDREKTEDVAHDYLKDKGLI